MMKSAKNSSYLIWGGYGGHNLGDEAILWAMALLLRRLHPSSTIYVMVREPLAPHVVEQYRQWSVTPVQFRSAAGLKALRTARLVVGGGQLLDDTLSLWPVGWTSLVLIANSLSRRRPLILCIGAEVIRRKLTAIVARRTYSLATAISLRDPASLAAARQLGISASKLLPTRDVVFSLPADVLPSSAQRTAATARVVLVVAHDPQRTPGKAGFFAALANELAGPGIDVVLVAHDLRMAYDYGLLLDLEKEFKDNPHIHVDRPVSVEQVLQLYANSDAVISSRMHPLILASLASTLPIAIAGTAKVNSLVEALQIPSMNRSEEIGTRQSRITGFLSERQQYIARIRSITASFAHEVEAATAKALQE